MGRYVMAEDYVRARRLRERLVRAVDHALAGVDVLAAPALAIPAPPIGATNVPIKGGSDVVRSAMLRNTQLFNLSRHPAVSLPCGSTREGLPVGLQLVGHRKATSRLLHDALAAEAVLARA
jgi:aspartyl-tRNA(Asn)/glutamyl-tRNA(Gln) amidotransferase subunit A